MCVLLQIIAKSTPTYYALLPAYTMKKATVFFEFTAHGNCARIEMHEQQQFHIYLVTLC